MSRSRARINLANRYDLSPWEADCFVLPREDEVVYEALQREAAKEVRLLLDQPHTTADGKDIVSHLMVVPRTQAINPDIKAIFSLDIYGRRVNRGAWHPISDDSITSQYSEYKVYWLCRASDHSAAWVQGVVKAILNVDFPVKSTREIKNEVKIKI